MQKSAQKAEQNTKEITNIDHCQKGSIFGGHPIFEVPKYLQVQDHITTTS